MSVRWGVKVYRAGRSVEYVGSLLLLIAAVVGALMMFIHSELLILTDRWILPEPIRVRRVRLSALIWLILLRGTLSVLTRPRPAGQAFRLCW